MALPVRDSAPALWLRHSQLFRGTWARLFQLQRLSPATSTRTDSMAQSVAIATTGNMKVQPRMAGIKLGHTYFLRLNIRACAKSAAASLPTPWTTLPLTCPSQQLTRKGRNSLVCAWNAGGTLLLGVLLWGIVSAHGESSVMLGQKHRAWCV